MASICESSRRLNQVDPIMQVYGEVFLIANSFQTKCIACQSSFSLQTFSLIDIVSWCDVGAKGFCFLLRGLMITGLKLWQMLGPLRCGKLLQIPPTSKQSLALEEKV